MKFWRARGLQGTDDSAAPTGLNRCRRVQKPPAICCYRDILPLRFSFTVSEEKSTLAQQIDPQWLAEFEAAARRPLEVRMRYAFIRTYKPVLDDADYRSFDTMESYRQWCEQSLPGWLGYGRV